MRTRISIIIPIYNVENYLSYCVDSLISGIDSDCEVILVNDGSTDDSLKVCEVCQKAYPDLVKIINKKNGGLSDARNEGTKIAQGDFIYYLDSDDWITPDAIDKLYKFAIKNNCDVVQGGFYYAYEKYLLYDDRWVKDTDKPFVLDRDTAMHELIKNEYIKNFAWGKLYKTEIVKRHLFPKGKYYEDSYWQHLIMYEVTRYGVMPEPLYYYRQRESGISGFFSIKNLDLLKGYKERVAFVNEFYPQFSSDMNESYRKICIQFNEQASLSGEDELINAFSNYIGHEGIRYSRTKYKIKSFVKRVWEHFFGKKLKRIER